MELVALCTASVISMLFTYTSAFVCGPKCLSLNATNIAITTIRGHFYVIEAGILVSTDDLNCVTVDFLQQEALQPQIQIYSFLTSNRRNRTLTAHRLNETKRGQYVREDFCDSSFRFLTNILFYDGRDLLVYECMETNTALQRFLLLSKKRTLTQSEKSRVYRAVKPLPKEYKLVPATYQQCDINKL